MTRGSSAGERPGCAGRDGAGGGAGGGGAVHVTGRFAALGHDFAVETDDPAFGRWLEGVLAPLHAPGTPRSRYVHSTGGHGHTLRHLAGDSDDVVARGGPASMLGHLLWHINRTAVTSADHQVVVHAAAAVHEGTGVLFPAPMEAGKTTLVAALVRAGFGYLTDEAVAIDPTTLAMQPYPRPLTLDPGSWDVLADVCPEPPEDVAAYSTRQRQVPPTAVRPDAVAAPTPARLVIVPRYQAGAAATVADVTRSQMLRLLAEQTFGMPDRARQALPVLAAVVRGASCHRLVFGHLDVACRQVTGLVESARRSDRGR